MNALVQNVLSERAKSEARTRSLRRGFTAAIQEMEAALSSAYQQNDDYFHQLEGYRVEIAKLRQTVTNYEKIVSARDRFGCWVCAQHEREELFSDAGDIHDEKESLRIENSQLRAQVKKLIENTANMDASADPLDYRSCLRSAQREGYVDRSERRIKFSRPSITSSEGRRRMSSMSDRMSLGGRDTDSVHSR
jgi:hypothetical protein